MKKVVGFLFVSLLPLLSFSQNVSLYHTGTQFDTFENPVQQGFQKNYSRKYALTLLPHINGFINFAGDGETAFKKLLFTRAFSQTSLGNFGEAKSNQLNGNANIYIANYKIFKTQNYNRELGFSLQLREEGLGTTTNETLALLDSYKNFAQTDYINAFNSKGYNQAYWQLGITYRENYDERWAFGAKASLLNGLIYNKVNIASSQLTINPNNSYTASVKGDYISSFGFKELTFKQLIPNIKNLGVAVSLAASYQTPSGFYFTANLKDAGFIHWGKKTSNYTFDSQVTVLNADSANSTARLFDQLKSDFNSTEVQESFNSKIDTRIEFAASKEFGFYKPVFVFSKSVFYPQGQIALINNLRKNNFVFSANAIYDLDTKLNFGSQVMVKSPNMEFYLGSEQIFPTYYLSKSYIKKDENIGKGNPRADFYIGINVKFGPKMQDIGNAEYIPGLNDKETGFVSRLSKKERKRLQKKNREIDKNRSKNDKRNNKRR